MVRLTAEQASALAYLARYPEASDKDAVLGGLEGEARQIDEAIVDHSKLERLAETVSSTASAIIQWAAPRGKRA